MPHPGYHQIGLIYLDESRPIPTFEEEKALITVDEFGALFDWYNPGLGMEAQAFRPVVGMYCLFVAMWCDDNPGRLPTPSLEIVNYG